jgi:hypothetical protein
MPEAMGRFAGEAVSREQQGQLPAHLVRRVGEPVLVINSLSSTAALRINGRTSRTYRSITSRVRASSGMVPRESHLGSAAIPESIERAPAKRRRKVGVRTATPCREGGDYQAAGRL